MGYGRIIGGGEDGRYTIELDYGKAERDALVAASNVLIARLDNSISTLLVRLAEAEVEEAAQIAKVQAQEAALIAATAGGLPPGATRPDTAGFRFEVQQLTKLRASIAPLRLKLQALQAERAQAVRQAAAWAAFNPIETRGAWCVDLTESAPVGLYVATVEIPGESNLILIAPGCRVWSPSDGILTGREIMSPAQAFLNAAILPGWQKFRPTYRWGTITAIDYDTDRCNVNLAPAVSSAQSLPVNQSSTLTGVPITYMTCNARVFEVGDRVVVQFEGQNWGSPRVIGFLDNPRACGGFNLTSVAPTFDGVASSIPYFLDWFFISQDADVSAAIQAALASSSLVLEFRINRGDWISATPESTTYLCKVGAKWGARFILSASSVEASLSVIMARPASAPFLSPDAPFYPFNANDIIEFRFTAGSEVLLNVAIQVNDGAPFLAQTGGAISAGGAGRLDYDLFTRTGA